MTGIRITASTQSMILFTAAKLQQFIDMAKKHKVHLFLQPVIRQHSQKQIHFTAAKLQQIIDMAKKISMDEIIEIHITPILKESGAVCSFSRTMWRKNR